MRVVVKELCRRRGLSEASYYLWSSNCGGMTMSEAKGPWELFTKNTRLKKPLAESMLEVEITHDRGRSFAMYWLLADARL